MFFIELCSFEENISLTNLSQLQLTTESFMPLVNVFPPHNSRMKGGFGDFSINMSLSQEAEIGTNRYSHATNKYKTW